jgi:hypothetical protein
MTLMRLCETELTNLFIIVSELKDTVSQCATQGAEYGTVESQFLIGEGESRASPQSERRRLRLGH